MKVVVTLDLDFTLLMEQKHELIRKAWGGRQTNELLEGIISLIDAVQDQAVENNGVDEVVVFGEPEEETV
jgi:hypothetical protein